MNGDARWREHLLVESQGPWAGPASARFLRDATALAGDRRPTRLVLVQDGVLAAVRGGPGGPGGLDGPLDAGVELWVDRFAWQQRGLTEGDLCPGATFTGMDELAGRVLDPAVQVVWH